MANNYLRSSPLFNRSKTNNSKNKNEQSKSISSPTYPNSIPTSKIPSYPTRIYSKFKGERGHSSSVLDCSKYCCLRPRKTRLIFILCSSLILISSIMIIIILCYYITIILYPNTTNIQGADKKTIQTMMQTPQGLQQQILENTKTSSNRIQKPLINFAGITLDVQKVRPKIWDTLFYFNCNYSVGIHIIASKGSLEDVEKARNEYILKHDLALTNLTDTVEKNNISKYSKGDGRNDEKCAPIIVINDNDIHLSLPSSSDHNVKVFHKDLFPNRIDRISVLRDHQRKLLYSLYSSTVDPTLNNGKSQSHDGIVMITDFDLQQLPPIPTLRQSIQNLLNPSYPYDALCTAGTTTGMKRVLRGKKQENLWYYDTFATVFLPDTFIHPLSRRYIPSFYKGENPSLVRSNNQYGNFTQADIMDYIKQHAGKGGKNKDVRADQRRQQEFSNERRNEDSNPFNGDYSASEDDAFRVKSCFGGMAAYRSSKYFTPPCKYSLVDDYTKAVSASNDKLDNNSQQIHPLGIIVNDPNTSILRYASSKEKRPCEHVVFHDCLRRIHGDDFSIAVHPELISYWKMN